MKKTFQIVELGAGTHNSFWEVVCLQTGEVVQRCESKEYAVSLCTRLNRKFNK